MPSRPASRSTWCPRAGDGKRVYLTSSLLEKWDKVGADNEQFLRGFSWDGKELALAFEVDFAKQGLGRAHHMKFSAKPGGKGYAELGLDRVAQAR